MQKFEPKEERKLKTKTYEVRELSGADLLVKTLIDLKVDLVFGYPGGAIMPVHDSLFRARDQIRHILGRHEQGLAHMAEGYARATGKPGVCFVTSGPGATNLVTGIADAMMDSVPLVCFTGQVPSTAVGTDAFQETDVIGITAPITKWNYQITKAEEIPYIVEKAFYLATTGRPGPVVIDITKDAQFEKVRFDEVHQFNPEDLVSYQPVYKPNKKQIELAADLINKSEKPLVLAGHGIIIAQAGEELKDFVEKANLPVACTLHGLSVIPKTHPNYVGFLGMHGNYAPNLMTQEADLIIALGMRFDDRVTGNLKEYAPKAKVIHIDIDPAEINKNVQAYIPIVADCREALRALIPQVRQRDRKEWFAKFSQLWEKEREVVINGQIKPKTKGILMAEVIHKLSVLTKGKANIVADVGQHQMIAARYYDFQRFNSFFSSGGMGTMGFGLPAALGVKLARPDELVIAVIGDGGFQMTLQELSVISQEGLDLKVVILNNEFLGMVRQWQELFFEKRYAYTVMKNPDFVRIAEAYGIPAERVFNRSDLESALNRLLNSDRGYLLEVVVEKEDMVFPMVPSGAALQDIILEVKR